MDSSEEASKRTFKPRFDGLMQFVTNYEEFKELEIGCTLAVLANGGNFAAYLEGCEPAEENQQRVFLQHLHIEDSGPIKGKSMVVREYVLPLGGMIYLKDFEVGKGEIYEVDN